MSKNNKCPKCKKPMTLIQNLITFGDGNTWHQECYEKEQAVKVAENILREAKNK